MSKLVSDREFREIELRNLLAEVAETQRILMQLTGGYVEPQEAAMYLFMLDVRRIREVHK